MKHAISVDSADTLHSVLANLTCNAAFVRYCAEDMGNAVGMHSVSVDNDASTAQTLRWVYVDHENSPCMRGMREQGYADYVHAASGGEGWRRDRRTWPGWIGREFGMEWGGWMRAWEVGHSTCAEAGVGRELASRLVASRRVASYVVQPQHRWPTHL
ncbi:hypothetical protein PMIN04_003912 [Paraphaeosphaeria minitans]